MSYIFYMPGWANVRPLQTSDIDPRLHTGLNAVQHRHAADAIQSLSSNCATDLGNHGISTGGVALKAASIEYYSTIFEGDYKISELVPSFDDRALAAAVGTSNAVTLVDAYGSITHSVVLGAGYFSFNPNREYGRTLAESQNITLVHESLHVYTGRDDIALAEKMGPGQYGSIEAASQAISTYLSKCY